MRTPVHCLSLAGLLAVLLASATPAQETTDLRKIRRGPWKQGYKIPDGWVQHRTAHYEIQSQAGKEKAERLGKHMEAMLKVYTRRFPPGKSLSTKKYTIKLLESRGAFRAYGAPPGAGAYYSPVDHEMVCYDTGKWLDEEKEQGQGQGPVTPSGQGDARDVDPLEEMKKDLEKYKMDILGAASHEGWHQYFHWYIVSWVPIPSWINEGMGDYFYTARPMKVKGQQVPAQLGRMNPTRLPVIQWAVKNGKHVPIKDILEYSQQQYYANPSICYAEGWALCQFLLHSGNKKYEAIVPRYIRLVQDDTNMPIVTKKAFTGVDLAQLEDEWKKWVLDQKLDGASAGKN